METKSINLPNNSPKHSKQHQNPYSYKRLICYSYVRVEKERFHLFDLGVMDIEHCDFYEIYLEHHFNMRNNVKQNFNNYTSG